MKKFRYLTLPLIILLGAFVYYQYQPDLSILTVPFRNFPEKLENPKSITLTCDYRGNKLTINETLYGSVNDYYKSEPKKKISYYTGNNKDFVFSYQEDKTISNLTDKIADIGEGLSLDDDQTLELAACFLQSIPYDEAKAKKILSQEFPDYPVNEVIPRYPYETLYEFSGICTDKSYLGAAIFSKMGYSTALLEFDKEKHLTIGIDVPDGYEQLGTGYAVMELTGEGFTVGDIPNIKATGFAQNTFDELPEIVGSIDGNVDSINITRASGIEIVSQGKEYTRIVAKTELKNEIESLKVRLEQEKALVLSAQAVLEQNEQELQAAQTEYEANPTRNNYSQYSATYNSYQASYNKANAAVNAYNNLVKSYNALIERYKQY